MDVDPTQLVLLISAGLGAGFIGGLVGVGGGLIFAPVLFFYFQSLGIAPEVLTPLTLGSSLFCTLVVSLVSSWYHYKKGTVRVRIAVSAGLTSAAAIFGMTRFVTTQPWYDATTFQVVFSVLLVVVAVRMFIGRGSLRPPGDVSSVQWPVLAATGTGAGIVAAAAGVGGGTVLVPAYSNLLRLPIKDAVGTSSTTIIFIAAIAVVTYSILGLGKPVPAGALGYVDILHSTFLAVPAVFSARFGVWVAHRVHTLWLRRSFAVLALFVALRMLWGVFA